MKTTDGSSAPDGSAWRPKKLSSREERRRAERQARRSEPESNEDKADGLPEKPAEDEPS